MINLLEKLFLSLYNTGQRLSSSISFLWSMMRMHDWPKWKLLPPSHGLLRLTCASNVVCFLTIVCQPTILSGLPFASVLLLSWLQSFNLKVRPLTLASMALLLSFTCNRILWLRLIVPLSLIVSMHAYIHFYLSWWMYTLSLARERRSMLPKWLTDWLICPFLPFPFSFSSSSVGYRKAFICPWTFHQNVSRVCLCFSLGFGWASMAFHSICPLCCAFLLLGWLWAHGL